MERTQLNAREVRPRCFITGCHTVLGDRTGVALSSNHVGAYVLTFRVGRCVSRDGLTEAVMPMDEKDSP